MNPQEYEKFIQRLYNAGPNDTNAINEMHTFVATPGSLNLILSSISSHQLSHMTLLISLSCIPHTKICNPGEMNFLRSWFTEFCFNEPEMLIADDIIALLVNIFIFIYEGDQKNGATFINDLAFASPVHLNLSLNISLRIIEKSEKIDNAAYIISIAMSAFANKNNSPQIINSATLLLLQILETKATNSRDFPLTIIKSGIEIGFPSQIFSFLFRSNGILTVNLLKFIVKMISFPAFSFPTQVIRQRFLHHTASLFLDYVKKYEITSDQIPAISSLFITLKEDAPIILQQTLNSNNSSSNTNNMSLNNHIIENDNNEGNFGFENSSIKKLKSPIVIINALVEEAANFTLSLLEHSYNLHYLELILDFWSNKDNIGSFISQKSEKTEQIRVKSSIIQRFFSNQSYQIIEEIEAMLEDRSNQFIEKLVDVFHFDLLSICKQICYFLSNCNDKNYIILAFSIEFLSRASLKEEMAPYFSNVLEVIVKIMNEMATESTVFEISLIHFFDTLLKRFLIGYSDVTCLFFIRFLTDIQSSDSSIEIIQEIIQILNSKYFSDECFRIIANNDQIFDLIVTSQLVNSPCNNQPKKVTKTLFQTLFQLGFSMPNPERFNSIINIITQRIRDHPNDQNAYIMMCGGFMATNANFDFIFNSLKLEFFPVSLKNLKENTNIFNPLLKMMESISYSALRIKNSYLSQNMIDFALLNTQILTMALNYLETRDNGSLEYLIIISICALISSYLLLNPNLNFGVLEFYSVLDFNGLINRILMSLLVISFDVFLQTPKLLDRYMTFIQALIKEDLTHFIALDDIIIQHQLQLLASILCMNNKEKSIKAAGILISLISQFNLDEISNFEKRCSSAILSIIFSTLNLLLTKSAKDEEFFKLAYVILSSFPKQRQNFFDSIFSRANSSIVDDLHSVIARINNSFNIIEDYKAINSLQMSLKSLINYARSNGINLEF